MSKYNYQVVGTALREFPTELIYGLVYIEGDVIEISKKHPFDQGWGKAESFTITDLEPQSFPLALEICYLSLVERKFYEAQVIFPEQLFQQLWNEEMEFMTFGMGPGGNMALWISGKNISVLVAHIKATETEMEMTDLTPYDTNISIEEFCSQFIDVVTEGNKYEIHKTVETYMNQYEYRYNVDVKSNLSEKETTCHKIDNKSFAIKWIEDSLFDGTYDKLHDGRLETIHRGGLPKSVKICITMMKTEWLIGIWFNAEIMFNIFDKFYRALPEKSTDIIIRIDVENKKYELALYRQGLKEPMIIPESAYQLIVFKNKFEDYRSENYNQPRGAWIW